MKWYIFKPNTPRNRQKLPPTKKLVLVQTKNLKVGSLNPVSIGYLKFHAGMLSEPYFVTPGLTIDSPLTDDRTLYWSDCLPADICIPPFDDHEDNPQNKT